MPVMSKKISTYSVSIISRAEPNNLAATVSLFDVDGKTVAFLRFYSPDNALQPNEFREDLGHPLVSYPSNALPSMVDILRNEKPLYFIWHDYMPVRCFGVVESARESIGESEPG